MTSSHSANILEVNRIGPSTDSILDELTLPLTFCDMFWFKFHPVERVIFYKLDECNTREAFDSIVLPQIKKSLSITLFHYPPLAGQLTWDSGEPKPVIKYTPTDTVSFTVAESNVDMGYISGNGIRDAIVLHPLIPNLSTSVHKASVIALQVTYFIDQGFCIGITSHHAVLDGQTLSTFLKSWAYICKHLVQQKQQQDHENVTIALPKELSPIFDRKFINDPNNLDTKLLNSWISCTKEDSDPVRENLNLLPSPEVDSNLVRATFELTREDISKLRNLVTVTRNENVTPIHLSGFVLTLAYVMVCKVKAKGGDKNRDVCFGFVADYRTRLDPPVPSTYFGNCVAANVNYAKAEDFIDEFGFSIAVEKISGLVTSLDTKLFERAHDTFEVFMNIKPGTQPISVAGSPHFGVYKLDFGWGKPEKMELVSIDSNEGISMSDCKDKQGGIEIGLSLNRNEMEIVSSLFFDGLKNL